jgi:hypothetical protein
MLIIGNGFLGKNIYDEFKKRKELSFLYSLREFNKNLEERILSNFLEKGFTSIILILGAGQERNYNASMLTESISLLKRIKKNHQKMIKNFNLKLITSGGTIYGYSKSGLFSESSILPEINSEYGSASKHIEELFFQLFPNSEFESISFRVGNVVSKFYENGNYGMLQKMVKCAESGTPFNLFVPVDTKRDFLSTEFLVSALKLVKCNSTLEGKINICNKEKFDIRKIIDYMSLIFPDLKIEKSVKHNQEIHSYNMDSDLLFNKTNLRSETLGEIIGKLI